MPLFGRTRRPAYRIGLPDRVGSGRNKLAALTAAGDKVERREANNLRRLIMPWQIRSFGYYDQLGEIKYAAQFYARMLAPLRLYAAEKDENGDWVETDDPEAKAALARIQDPGGGTTSLLSTYGRLMFLTGEAYLLCTIDKETGFEQWEMVSTDELRLMDGVYMRYSAPMLMSINYEPAPDDAYEPLGDDQAVVYRLWKRHPRYSSLADATMQGVLDTCEELVLLARAVRGRLRSRMAGPGILFLDDSITTVPAEPSPDEDPLEDPFVADLTEAITAPIVDEGTASSVVPMVARVSPPENPDGTHMKVSDLVYLLQINDPNQVYPELGMARECVERLAIGLDMPAEILTGMGDINHWGAWQVDEQTWKSHGQPIAQQLVDDLTASYYRLELRERGVKNWANYAIAYDPSAVINHPDRTRDAKQLFADGELSGESYRGTLGFTEDDAPTAEERQWWLGWQTRDAGFAVSGVPTRAIAAEVTAGVSEGPTPDENTAEKVAESSPDVTKAAPADSTPPAETVIGAARILGAADVALLRSREAAGNRLRSLAKRDKDSENMIKGVRPGQIAFTLGRDRVKALNAPGDLELVAGIRDLFGEALEQFGIRDAAIAEMIGENLEKHAARTLYDERPPAIPSQLANLIQATCAGKRPPRRRAPGAAVRG